MILTVVTENIPRVLPQDRVEIEQLGDGFMRVILHFGFMERPNIPKALAIARKLGWTFEHHVDLVPLPRRSVRPDARSGMPHGRTGFSSSSRKMPTMRRATSSCPPDRVVEIGTQVTV